MPLPDRRAGLPQPERARPLLEPEHAHPHPDRAARHQHDLAPGLAQPRQALDDLHDAAERQLDAVVRDDVRAQLDDDAVRIGEVLARFGRGGRRHWQPGNLPSGRAEHHWRRAIAGLVRYYAAVMLAKNQTLTVLGCGTMGEAIVRGILRSGRLKPAQIFATDRRAEVVKALREKHGIRTTSDNREACRAGDVVLVCVKPHEVGPLLRDPEMRAGCSRASW